MGNCWGVFKKTNVKKRIVLILIGLDNAGKTQTINNLIGEVDMRVLPTVGFKAVNLKYHGYPVTIYDLGGSVDFRQIWHQYFSEVYGVIFVIDSSDIHRLGECKSVLEEVISHDKVAGKPILILANKQDKRGALDDIDIVDKLNIEALVNRYRCPTLVESYTATLTPKHNRRVVDPGLKKGYQWLINYIIHRFGDINLRVQTDMYAELQRRKAQTQLVTSFENPNFAPKVDVLVEQGVAREAGSEQSLNADGNDSEAERQCLARVTVESNRATTEVDSQIKWAYQTENSGGRCSGDSDSNDVVVEDLNEKTVFNRAEERSGYLSDIESKDSGTEGSLTRFIEVKPIGKRVVSSVSSGSSFLGTSNSSPGSAKPKLSPLFGDANVEMPKPRIVELEARRYVGCASGKSSAEPISRRTRPNTTPVASRADELLNVNKLKFINSDCEGRCRKNKSLVKPSVSAVETEIKPVKQCERRPQSASLVLQRQLQYITDRKRRFSLRYTSAKNKTSPEHVSIFHFEPKTLAREEEGLKPIRASYMNQRGDVTY